jgi:flagellar basal-body rod protein FlgB
MPISDLPILSMLRTKMHWHEERQRVLAENVANADTPRFRPNDLLPPDLQARRSPLASLTLAQTDPAHLAGGVPSGSAFDSQLTHEFEVVPSGNGVNLEDEMMKVASNQIDYQAATALYTRSLGLIKIAMGKG